MLNRSKNHVAGLMAAGIIALGSLAPVAVAMDIPPPSSVSRSEHSYTVPPITLVDQYGHRVRLDHALAGDKPALVQFFFTSCTTICGVRSAQIVAAAPKLRKANIDIGFYTISIDPDHDTPERLLAFSRQFGDPPPSWHLLTGTEAKVRQTEAAFNASDPAADKMMHEPLTFIRGGKGQPWERILGLTTTDELVQQIKQAVAAAP